MALFCSNHGNDCHLYTTGAIESASKPLPPAARRSTAWAMVPLYPNEDTPPPLINGKAASCTGSTQPKPSSDLFTCGLRVRSCAFGAASPRERPIVSLSSPEKPAPGSEWPALAFMLPIAMGSMSLARGLSITEATEPISIGSPRAVPVPCASTRLRVSGGEPVSSIAALITRRWAFPFGAVSDALLPSQRTAAPSRNASSRTETGRGDKAAAPTASDRA